MPASPLAVIDIGSNSARVVIFRLGGRGEIEVVGDRAATLRLVRGLDADGRLGRGAIERALRALHDFRQLAIGAGASQTVAVATAAVREATNGSELLRRADAELGLEVTVLDAGREARYAAAGAVYGLPVRHGLVLDVGGGSLQLARVRDRAVHETWGLALGSLRLSDRFLRSDPPAQADLRKLRRFVHQTLEDAGVPTLRAGETLVGTGGTVRNLAKVDSRRQAYPIPRLHGYELGRGRLREVIGQLASLRARARASVPGLSRDRVDSIVGGGIVVECLMDHLRARHLLVAGLGLREGLMLATAGARLPAAEAVRALSIRSLTGRFSTGDGQRAARRLALTQRLARLLGFAPSAAIAEMLDHAAVVLDVGRSVEYYRRHSHSAAIVRAADLFGFGHREIVLLSAIVDQADGTRSTERRYLPLLGEDDRLPVARAAALLALADALEHRLAPGEPPHLTARVRPRRIVLEAPALAAWESLELEERFHRAFGRKLEIAGASG